MFGQSIINKVSAMPNVLDLTMDLKTFIAVIGALIAGVVYMGEDLAFVRNGDDAITDIKVQLDEMKHTILDEHKLMRQELADFKEFENARHEEENDSRTEMAIRINNSETTNQFMQKDMDHLVRSMDLLHEKIDRVTHRHDYPQP